MAMVRTGNTVHMTGSYKYKLWTAVSCSEIIDFIYSRCNWSTRCRLFFFNMNIYCTII